MDPSPGIDLINEDPLFIDLENYNFSYIDSSPCINNGNPEYYDPDGTISDIGANIYSSLEIGDCNQDFELNIMDIIYIINNCILDVLVDNCNCSDLNQDGDYNVLDVVYIVNLILSN